MYDHFVFNTVTELYSKGLLGRHRQQFKYNAFVCLKDCSGLFLALACVGVLLASASMELLRLFERLQAA